MTTCLGRALSPFLLMLCTAIAASAQSDPVAVGKRAVQQELEQWWFVNSTVDNGPDTPSGTAFVEHATAVRSWSLSITASSKLASYEFPLTLKTNLFRALKIGGSTDGFKRRLVQSELSATYAPLTVQPKPENQPGVSARNARTGSVAFKIALFGTKDIDDFDNELTQALATSVNRLLPAFRDPTEPNLLDEQRLNELGKAIQEDMKGPLNDVKDELSRQLVISAKTNYGWDSRAGRPDSLGATFLGNKAGFSTAGRATAWSGSISYLWFLEGASVRRVSGAVAVSIELIEGLKASVQTALDHYAGTGFKGISGVADKTQRHDFSLAQVFTFAIPGKDKLEFSIKEIHLGTGSTDVAVSLAFGIRLW